jgi:hypothetical protein
MSAKQSRFELLPNEILIEIFEYVDARKLYQAFYDLNFRLNILLQSLNHLHLFIHYDKNKNDRYDSLYALQIQSIIIDRNRLMYNLDRFMNVRCLIFLKSSGEKVEQIVNQLHYLEYLAIKTKIQPSKLCLLYSGFFSNKFPTLKSCTFTSFEPKFFFNQWTSSPAIRFLNITSFNPNIHRSLLSACPNLHSLKLSIPRLNLTPSNQPLNINLKRLVLIFTTGQWPIGPIFNSLFACTPNLERLYIERLVINEEVMNSLDESDWLAKVLVNRLQLLRQFKLSLRLSDKQDYDKIDSNRLKTSFMKFHENRYECQLIMN